MSDLDDLLFGPMDKALEAVDRLISYKSLMRVDDDIVSNYPIIYAPYIPLLYCTCISDQYEFDFVRTINKSSERQVEFYFDEDGSVSYL